jgi:prepilin-type processing-associated H-X9-DG protein
MRKLTLAGALALASCVGPTTTVRTVDTRPALAISGAPSGSVLFVDGHAVGDPSDYDGRPNILRVEAGTHQVDIRDRGGNVLFSQRVFVESELKTVQVH